MKQDLLVLLIACLGSLVFYISGRKEGKKEGLREGREQGAMEYRRNCSVCQFISSKRVHHYTKDEKPNVRLNN